MGVFDENKGAYFLANLIVIKSLFVAVISATSREIISINSKLIKEKQAIS